MTVEHLSEGHYTATGLNWCQYVEGGRIRDDYRRRGTSIGRTVASDGRVTLNETIHIGNIRVFVAPRSLQERLYVSNVVLGEFTAFLDERIRTQGWTASRISYSGGTPYARDIVDHDDYESWLSSCADAMHVLAEAAKREEERVASVMAPSHIFRSTGAFAGHTASFINAAPINQSVWDDWLSSSYTRLYAETHDEQQNNE